jgi:hypothetical protein
MTQVLLTFIEIFKNDFCDDDVKLNEVCTKSLGHNISVHKIGSGSLKF